MQRTIESNSQDLADLFTHERPFGPTNATNIIDQKVFLRLFDPHNKIANRFKYNRSLIIGRKGSGKTSFLRGLADYKVQEILDTAATFSKIVEAVDEKSRSFMFVEKVSQLWEHIFTLCLFRGIASKYGEPIREVGIIRDYCAKNELAGEAGIEDMLWKILKAAKNKAKNEAVSSVAAVIAEIAGEDYSNTRNAALKVLRVNKERAIVLVDSLEQYPVKVDSVAHAMTGLLHCVGEFNERNKWINVRLCLPAEMYHTFLDLSANPLKDFSNSITLHWHPRELLAIAASRFQLFLSMQYPKENLLFDISEKKGPQDFLRQFLPDHVVNGIGHPEDSLAYILRHTQLMPRQLLLILNSIFQLAYSDEVKTYPVVDATSVVVGIKHVESRLTQEVCSAFRNRYPDLKAVCESVIKYLPLIFDEGILHNVFNLHGKKAFALGDFDDFKRMLVEAAVVGRVVNDVGDRYVEGMFEYTAAHKLIISTDDKLCLHPIFAEVFHFKKSSDDRAIYPWGTDPDCDDYRDHQLWI